MSISEVSLYKRISCRLHKETNYAFYMSNLVDYNQDPKVRFQGSCCFFDLQGLEGGWLMIIYIGYVKFWGFWEISQLIYGNFKLWHRVILFSLFIENNISMMIIHINFILFHHNQPMNCNLHQEI